MATLIPNTFSSYELSIDEEIQGALLTITQKQYIQNQIALCAEEKIALEYDATNSLLFLQQEAYKRGQIDAYRFILECCEIAEETMKNNSAP